MLKLKNIRLIGGIVDIQGTGKDIKALSKYADIVHMPSNFVKEFFIRKYSWFPKKNAMVIYNGVIDLKSSLEERDQLRQNFDFSPDDIVIGYVGQFSTIKRVPWVLNHLLPLLSKHDKVKILLAGSGETLNEVHEIVKINKLENRVTITGYVENISTVVPVFDIGFLASTTEGLGSTLLEYLSAAVPQIASNVGGIPEVVQNKKTGFLFAPEDSTEMVEKFELLVSNTQLREQMALVSRQRYEDFFTTDLMVDAFLKKIII